jgi:beta-N-acetylhexosaminidase
VHPKLLALVAVVLAACAPAPGGTPAPSPIAIPSEVGAEPTVDALLESLSPRDRIAQLVVPYIPGAYAAYDDAAFARMQAWVDSLHVGGLIFSVGSPLDIAAKLNRLQQRSRIPLLVTSDLEGGTSIRLVGGTFLPPNMGIGATGSDSLAYQMGRIAASEIRGIQDHGLLETAKHFPGHGDTGTDSHIALPVITASWGRLDSVELVPFRAAIAAGVKVVMSAHIALPGIDRGQVRPGTVAPEVLTGILRDSLRFGGLVVTDALNMSGVASAYGAEAGVRAFLAGADLLLQPADPGAAIAAMEAAMARGEITAERLDRSVRRVLAIKKELGLYRRRTVPLDSIPAVVGSAAFQAEARTMAARSIVMVKDVGGTIHGLRSAHPPLTVVTYAEEDNRAMGQALVAELRAQGFPVTAVRLWPASGAESYDSAARALGRNAVGVIVTADRPIAGRGTIGLPARLAALISASARTIPTILVSLGNPYLVSSLPEVGSYLIGWRSNPVVEEAVARALAGTAPITGHLPITIPPSYPRGWGLQRRVP